MSNPMQFKIGVLRATPKRLAAILPKLESQIQAIRADARFAEPYKAEQIGQARAAAREQLETLYQSAVVAEQGLRKNITEALNEKPVGEEALARELALDRAWRRVERLLEAGEDPTTLIREAAEAGDLTSLQALKEELPAFLRAKGQTPVVKPALDLITRLETPLLSPEHREVRAVELELSASMPQLNSAVEFVRMGIEGQPVTVIPDWPHKQIIRVDYGGQQ